MFISKIWFILVTVVGGVALSIALTAPRPMAQKLEDLEGQRLDRTQYATEQMLKVDARKWIDWAAKLGRDAVLSDSLDAATRNSGELAMQHKSIQNRFRAMIPDLAGAGIATLAAIDGNGRVVARVGDRENDYGDSIGGGEVIADALRGYLSDDVWGAGGHLLRVAAAPVLSKGRDRIVGALLLGVETGEQFVERLKNNLQVDVALLLRGKVAASTLNPAPLAVLKDLLAQGRYRDELDKSKRTSAIPIEVGNDTLLAVAAPFPGQASQQDAFYVLIGKKPANADLTTLLAATSARDLGWSRFPWIALVLGILGLVAVGLLLQRLEVEAPIAKLRAELRTLARGDALKLDDHRYGGKFGGIARDVNAAIEHYSMAPGPPAPMAGKDLGAILGGDAPSADSAFAGTANAFAAVPPPAAPAFGTAAKPLPTAGPGGGFAAPPPPAPSGFGLPPAPAFAPPPSPGFMPPAPGTLRGLPGLPGPPPGPAADSGLPVPAPPPSSRPPHAVPSGASAAAGALEDEERHIHEIFDEYVATKQKCGESTVGLTLDKFRLRLQENKNTLMAKHACRTVRFAVHVKDGKASLRATPVK